jgi:4-amino-4-deoxy-L-arabinose transferase-like glycosyltransferase
MDEGSLNAATPHLAARQLSHGIAIILITLYALPLLLIHLGSGDPNDMMELFNLVPIKEAYRDGHWLMPTLNGLPRLEKPPLPVWIPAALAKLTGCDSLWVERVPSIIAALLTCLATYAIGCVTLGRRSAGFMSAIILATMALFLRQARIASYDIFATAFITLALLGLIGMVRPGRSWPWAVLAGIALGLANLSKGPVPPATVCLPFGLWMLLYHRKSWPAWRRLLLSFIVCIAVTAPWFIAIELRLPGAHKTWLAEFLQYSAAKGPQYNPTHFYYLGILAWVMPWTALLIAGLLLPFMGETPASDDGGKIERRWHLLFWLIVVLGAVLLTIPSEKKNRYALQLFPAAALLCAAVWQQFIRLRANDKITGAARVLVIVQPTILAGMGLAILLGLLATFTVPEFLTHISWLPQKAAAQVATLPAVLRPGFDFLGIFAWVAVGLAAVALATVMWRMQKQRRFQMAFLAFALGVWPVLLGWNWVYRGVQEYHANPFRAPTEQMVRLAEGRPIYTLSKVYSPWLHVMFFADRILPQETVEELAALAQKATPVFVLAPVGGSSADADRNVVTRATMAMESLQRRSGCRITGLFTFSDEHYDLTLYRLDKSK